MKLYITFKRKVLVKTGYLIKFTGIKYRALIKKSHIQKEQFVECSNNEEVLYLFGLYLTDPGVKIYAVYNDGSMRRIKSHRSILKFKR